MERRLFCHFKFCVFIVAFCLCEGKDSPDIKPDDTIDHRYFLLQLFQKYGQNGLIGYEGFEHLLSNLGLGGSKVNEEHDIEDHRSNEENFDNELHDKLGLHNAKHEHMIHERSIDGSIFSDEIIITEHNFGDLPNKKEIRKRLGNRCLSPKQMLVAYGVATDHNAAISPLMFLHICPAMIYQLDSKECEQNSPVEDREDDDSSFKWLSALTSVFIISIAGLVGVAVVPLIHKSLFAHLINFLVALAIGTLTGDALLHLIPHALKREADESETVVVMKSSAVFVAAFAFFILEKLIHGAQTIKKPTEEELKMKGAPSDEDYTVVKSSDSCDGLSELATPDGSKREAVAWMIIMSDGIHNFTDGLAIGAAFGADFVAGLATSVAVFTHELPHELGDFAVLLKAGVPVRRALMYNVLSSMLSMLGVMVGVILGDLHQASSWIYAGTAGTFIYIALADLVPEINRQQSSMQATLLQVVGIFTGGIIMLVIALYEHRLKAFFFQAF